MSTTDRSSKHALTEKNLRLNSANHLKSSHQIEARSMDEQTRTGASDFFYQYNVDDCDEMDEDEIRDIALRRAASLEALQAYGGCFVSGFLAMQDPLPWILPTPINTASSGSLTSAGSPRPDSDTLSSTDAQESTDGRKRNWRSMGRMRSAGRKSKR